MHGIGEEKKTAPEKVRVAIRIALISKACVCHSPPATLCRVGTFYKNNTVTDDIVNIRTCYRTTNPRIRAPISSIPRRSPRLVKTNCHSIMFRS